MSQDDLVDVYRKYLACLNERRWSDLGDFVAEELSYNHAPMMLSDYRAMLEADVDAIPDLRFEPEILLADAHVVACRLFFDCTPRHAFLGFAPKGGRVHFAEHVFYRFVDGRIVEVWSVIDREAIRQQV
ncbi:ester cyclase [Mycolicibacterium sp. 050158]|uniref:ester cyclase n=1 Tax=Mycolicibacterium sp. 050158 TaxID=3090602 RepID=UPI00299E4723|nr:ester cyclase [Mycolicibacterium sp. 050158]MDX1890526.1 ester cyclase [Mycolicibacterium sp. 050158]